MRIACLLCLSLSTSLLPTCHRAEPVPAPQSPATPAEAPRNGERLATKVLPKTDRKSRGGREIRQAKLSAAQNQFLVRHRQKSRLPGNASVVSTEPVAALLLDYQAAHDVDEKVDALNALAGRDDPEAFKLLMLAAAEGEAPERVAALEALAVSPRAAHLPAVQSAVQSDDWEVRLTGVSLLGQIHAESALPLWMDVLNHPSAEVTQFGFEQLADLPPHLQVPIAKQALARDEPWMTEQSLNLLGGITSKSAVEALIPFLEHPTSGDLAKSGLFFLLSEPFDTVEQASQWWQQHSGTLGPDLQLKELN